MFATTPDTLGSAVRQRRLDLDWSQQRLADEAGVSRQWVSAFERGKESAELGAVLRAVRVLGLLLDVVEVPEPTIDLGSLGHD